MAKGKRREGGKEEKLRPTTSMSPGALSLLVCLPLLLLSTAVAPYLTLTSWDLHPARDECGEALYHSSLTLH